MTDQVKFWTVMALPASDHIGLMAPYTNTVVLVRAQEARDLAKALELAVLHLAAGEAVDITVGPPN